MLAAHGATSITLRYEAGVAAAITCTLPTPIGERSFRLRADIDATQRKLARDYAAGRAQRRQTTREQAARVIWRTLQDWLEATVELIDAGGTTMDEALFAHLLPERGEQTIYEEYVEREQLLLPEGGTE